MKIVDLSDSVFRDLGEPSDTSLAPIAYWFRNNLGQLNAAINTNFYIDEATQEIYFLDFTQDPNGIPTEMPADEASIYKLIYILHWYDMQIRKNILSYTASPVIEITDNGHTIRTVSPTEIGKVLASFRKDIAKDLRDWITWYKVWKATPKQVTGDDTIAGPIESRPIYRRTYNLYNGFV